MVSHLLRRLFREGSDAGGAGEGTEEIKIDRDFVFLCFYFFVSFILLGGGGAGGFRLEGVEEVFEAW